MTKHVHCITFCAMLLALTLVASPAAAQDRKPNILVIMGDDVGYWNTSAYNRGMMGYQTPNIDRIANEAAELQVLRLVRGEEGAPGRQSTAAPQLLQQAIFDARAEVQQLPVAEAVERYMVVLVSATRYPERFSADLQTWIRVGASPRGTLALDRAARAHAWLHGGAYVTPDDVHAVVHDGLRHRLILSYEANAEGLTADDVIKEVVKRVAVA